jgi:hypothetical protein
MAIKNKNNEIEFCVQCGTETQYKKRDSVDYRIGYIEGAGQLCNKCQKSYNKLKFIK